MCYLQIVQDGIDRSAQPCIYHNKAVLGRFVKRICSQDIFESGELYATELRSPGDDLETQPLVAFLHNLQGLATHTALSKKRQNG